MTDLHKISISIEYLSGTLNDLSDIEARLAAFKPEAIRLLEASDQASLTISRQLPDLRPCASLIICDKKAELRLEKNPFAKEFQARFIMEADDRPDALELWRRDSAYCLRGCISAPHAQLEVPAGFRHLAFREYFLADANGWLRPHSYRLVGLGAAASVNASRE